MREPPEHGSRSCRRSYPDVKNARTNQDYSAILMGEVTVIGLPRLLLAPSYVLSVSDPMQVSVPNISAEPVGPSTYRSIFRACPILEWWRISSIFDKMREFSRLTPLPRPLRNTQRGHDGCFEFTRTGPAEGQGLRSGFDRRQGHANRSAVRRLSDRRDGILRWRWSNLS